MSEPTTTHTLEQITKEIERAVQARDASALETCAEELASFDSPEAGAWMRLAKGVTHQLRGGYPAALEHLRRAHSIFEELGDRQKQASATVGIGTVHRKTGNYPAALEHYQQARTIYEDLADGKGLASATNNIGIVHQSTGNYPAALEHYQQARTIYEELGDRLGLAQATNNIGTVHYYTGNYPAALEHYQKARTIHEELGDRPGLARATNNIGNVHQSSGNYPAGLEHYQQARTIFEELGDRLGLARATGNIGTVHQHTGNNPAALEHFLQARSIFEELGGRQGLAISISNIGIVHQDTGNYPAALEHYQQARTIYEELGDRQGLASATGGILSTLLDQESFQEAGRMLAEMDDLEIDDPPVRLNRKRSRARILAHDGDLSAAWATLEAALKTAREYDLPEQKAEMHKQLRDLAQQRNDFPGYIEHNDAFNKITDEIRGAGQQRLLAIQEKERELQAISLAREREREVLYSTLPKHVADRVIAGEQVTDHYDTASVLFLDIAGFTSLSSLIPAGHVVRLLEAIFSACDQVCERHGITKVKTIGDSYMAVGGVPEETTDHGQRTANAALDMLAALKELEVEMPEDLGDKSWVKNVGEIDVRIGVHYGPVVAGVVGKERLQYDVWGDTVNVASRMESTGEPGRVQVSEEFADSLGDSGGYKLQPRTIDVKGKGEMKTYWLEARPA